MSILKYEELKFRNKILKEKEQGKQKLHKGNQNKHQLNSNEYIAARDKGNPRVYKSYLLKNGEPMENKKEYYSYVEELYKEAAGRGRIKIKKFNGIYEIRESYMLKKTIGKTNSNYTDTLVKPSYIDTDVIEIRYSKRGYHLFPIDK